MKKTLLDFFKASKDSLNLEKQANGSNIFSSNDNSVVRKPNGIQLQSIIFKLKLAHFHMNQHFVKHMVYLTLNSVVTLRMSSQKSWNCTFSSLLACFHYLFYSGSWQLSCCFNACTVVFCNFQIWRQKKPTFWFL